MPQQPAGDKILILDFGSQYTQVIARRIRECQVLSKIYHFSTPAAQLQADGVIGIILSGGPSSVFAKDAPMPDRAIFELGVPILGIVENMAVHICSKCGHAEHIFGEGGGKKMAGDYNMDYLGALPLDINIRLQADNGRPTVVADPDGEVAGIYKAVARKVAVSIAAKNKDFSAKFPSITISKNT
jgi:ATP-binding protein involved in chromosome partitioning